MANQDRPSAAHPQGGAVVPLRRPAKLAVVEEAKPSPPGERAPRYRLFFARHRRLLKRAGIGVGILGGAAMLGCAALWWRLASGPIQFDIVTPWLTAAIEENFGSQRHVEVGGTQIERTENGGAAVRIRDIVVRDADGTVVASAPKAEVRISGMSLLSGHLRAESLNLVGAEMAVRIERDGGVTVFAGADKHPIATAAASPAAAVPLSDQDRRKIAQTAAAIVPRTAVAPATIPPAVAQPPPRRAGDIFAAMLSRIDSIRQTGLDGHELRELGLKNGNLSVDDERTGKRWAFRDISLSVQRLHSGGVELAIGSDNTARPWGLTASIAPEREGYRRIALKVQHISASDLLLASRLGDGTLQADVPLSADVEGEIGPDGVPQSLAGRIVVGAGLIGDSNSDDGRLAIDRAEVKLDWDATGRVLSLPFQIISGGNRITLLAKVEAPAEIGGDWLFKIGGGTVVLAASGVGGDPLILNHIAVNGRYDATRHRVVVSEGDIGNSDVGVALSGNMDFSGSEPRLALGVAGTRMPADALKRLWPVFVSPKVRDWVNERLTGGTLERIVIAVNSPLEALKDSGPPIPDDGLSLEAAVTGCLIRPVDGLPALRDADLDLHIIGRDALVTLGKAMADMPSGRKLAVSAGSFEVPDTALHPPLARVRFKVDGPIPAAAELLRMERLRDLSDLPFEPSAVRGTMSAQVTLAMPIKPEITAAATSYSIAVDATNFAAEHMIMGRKVEAALLKASATPQGFQLKGDVKIGDTPATLEYRKLRSEPEAEIKLAGMLDEAGRKALGLDAAGAIAGAIPVRLNGHLAATSDREGRFAVEADLTQAQISGLLPGWMKPSGKPARATFTIVTRPQSVRIEDLLIEGAGGGVKGTVEFDGSGELQSANFPAYGFSDGDRASLKVDRAADGALRVTMRGDVYDGRAFIKAAAGGGQSSSPSGQPGSSGQPGKPQPDVDLDVKFGAVVGFNGEALRSVVLKMSRRAGEIRSFGLTAKIGHAATLAGELRGQTGGREEVRLESDDAGAFFRFADVYPRMIGGQISIAMDPPSATNRVQRGVLAVRNFAIHDETQLERAVTNGPQGGRNDIDFSGMRVEFTRTPSSVALHNGVVRGPLLGGTIDGLIDYARDDVHLRGTLVPLYGPNNLLGQLPVIGLFLGGEKEGLVGITYEVVGQPGNAVLRVNPISALAPGLLRKVFEFPAGGEGGEGADDGAADTVGSSPPPPSPPPPYGPRQ